VTGDLTRIPGRVASRAAAVAAGLAPAAAALAAQWLLHVAVPGAPFAPYSVGEWIIRHAPGGLATTAIEVLGRWALRLLAAITIGAALALGVALRRRPPAVIGATAVAASLGASLLDPSHPSIDEAVLAGVMAGTAAALAAMGTHSGGAGRFDPGRRRLISGLLGGLAMLALGGSALWRILQTAGPGGVAAAHPLGIHPDPSFDRIAGLSPLVTPRQDHYVVDIDLVAPSVAASGWRLRIDGHVQQPLTLSLDELLAMPTVERLACMSCISNPVGGTLVGDSTWTGVPLAELLRRAGVSVGASTLVASGADGYFETIPLDVAMLPLVLVVVAMDGEFLPREHGFPARLLVPGRYGFKSVKWLQTLSAVSGSPQGYWVERGWDPSGVIRTESRFDVPTDHGRVAVRFTAAGVAWAGDRGISGVEVSADDGLTWNHAILEPVVDPLAWRRWRVPLTLQPGVHALFVRAIDGTGAVQSAAYLPPHPSGASGYHRIVVSVDG